MYYSGFADEAGDSLDVQIQATRELGWQYIEARSIDGENITNISDSEFEEVYQKLSRAGVKINCFGSEVANWGKDPLKEEDYIKSLEELKRAIPRMQRLGAKMIRGMSFSLLKEENPDNSELEKVVLKKLKNLVKICEDAGIIYVHENCMNHFSQSYLHMDRLVNLIDSPAFKIVFDTGNPVMAPNRMGQKPYRRQTSWEAYSHLKDYIYYVHVKDGRYIKETEGIFPEVEYTFPGEGDGEVRKIIKDLLANGYDGGFSIEPHMGSVFHEKDINGDKSREKYRYETYVEYGQRLTAMVDEIKKELAAEDKTK